MIRSCLDVRNVMCLLKENLNGMRENEGTDYQGR